VQFPLDPALSLLEKDQQAALAPMARAKYLAVGDERVFFLRWEPLALSDGSRAPAWVGEQDRGIWRVQGPNVYPHDLEHSYSLAAGELPTPRSQRPLVSTSWGRACVQGPHDGRQWLKHHRDRQLHTAPPPVRLREWWVRPQLWLLRGPCVLREEQETQAPCLRAAHVFP
jgi:hypothetical protein